MKALREPNSQDGATVRIVLAEARPGEAWRCVRELCLIEPGFRITSVATLPEMMAALTERKPDVLVLDLALPEGEGLEALRRVLALVPGLPVIILATAVERELAQRALETGACDYLLKEHMDQRILHRALQSALWRTQEAADAQSGSLMDELTGLYLRDGFWRLAARHFDYARKQDATLVLLCVDLESLEEINRVCGREEGDRALLDATKLLQQSFRRTDLLGRIGESQFAVLAIDAAGPSAPVLRQRLERRLEALNLPANRPFSISLSMGLYLSRPAVEGSLQDVFRAAEADLLARKPLRLGKQPALANPSGTVPSVRENRP